MRRPTLRPPSPAMAVAFLASIAALGGSAYAAGGLPDSSGATARAHRRSRAEKRRRVRDRRQDKRLFRKTFASSIGGAHVAFAAGAGSAASAQTAARAQSAVNADNAAHAATADSAPLPATLPSGQTLTGAYGMIGKAGGGDRIGTAISFAIPLASAPSAHLIEKNATPPAQCPGTPADPAALPGNLCIYESVRTNISSVGYEDPLTGYTGEGVRPFGAEVVGFAATNNNYDDSGSWAVTAP